MDDLEKELKEGFLEEASGLLTDAEQCFLQLENAKDDPSIIDKIFRLAHNFKGSAGAVGFAALAAFAHKFESFLLKIKNNEIPVNSTSIDVLLRGNDFLGKSLEILKADMGAEIGGEDLSAELLDYIEGRRTVENSASAPSPENIAPETSQVPEPVVSEAQPNDPVPVAVTTEPAGSPDQWTDATQPAQTSSPESAPEITAAPAAPSPQAAKPEVQEVKSAPAATNKPTAGGAPLTDESIRVSFQKLESLINNVGEVVILQTVLNQQRFHIPSPLVQKTVVQLAKITKDLQNVAMSLRMLPIKQTFRSHPENTQCIV